MQVLFNIIAKSNYDCQKICRNSPVFQKINFETP